MSIAFFDLDKTVLSRNSGSLWFKAEFRGGHITLGQALQAATWISLYHLGFADLQASLLKSIAQLAGTPEAAILERTRTFYQAQVRPLFRPGALEAIDRHRTAGDKLVLLTTSSNYVSEPVMAELGFDDALCNRFEVDGNGHYTGRPLGPLCFGPGKLELGRAWADRAGVSLSACTFYTDSASDLPMLEAVGRPVAVCPDPRLRRIAERRRWEIVDWGEPGAYPASLSESRRANAQASPGKRAER